MAKIEIVDSEATPKCPFCEKELDKIEKINHGSLERHIVYMYPHCKKVLSIGYNYYS